MLILKKLRRFGLALLFVGLFAHSSHAQKVTTEWAKGFNFGELKYFAWRKNNLVTVRNPEGSKILDQKIMHVVTQALASKGIVEDSTNRSEEHTSELQSPVHRVCRLLLEKKKVNKQNDIHR